LASSLPTCESAQFSSTTCDSFNYLSTGSSTEGRLLVIIPLGKGFWQHFWQDRMTPRCFALPGTHSAASECAKPWRRRANERKRGQNPRFPTVARQHITTRIPPAWIQMALERRTSPFWRRQGIS
jgi:hypothetical protein